MLDVANMSTALYTLYAAIFGFLLCKLANIRRYERNEKNKSIIDAVICHLREQFPKIGRILSIFGPLLWPGNNSFIQLNIAAAFITIVVGCVVNIYVPVYGKSIADSLRWTSASNHSSKFGVDEQFPTTGNFLNNWNQQFRWDYILIYVGLKIVQGFGSISLLNCTQSLIWINIEQHIKKNIEVHFFEHIHNLSARWHSNTKTSDILAALDMGTDSLNSILEHIILCFLPIVADIIIAVYYLSSTFSSWFGIAVFFQMMVYLIATVWLTEWRAKFQRTMNNADNQRRHQALESLLNFETVKYFANESYETKKFAKTISQAHDTQWKATISIVFLQLIQLLVMKSGLLFGSLVVVYMITKEDNNFSVGDYILFTSYLSQLYGPLNYLGTYYRSVRTGLVDLEYMLEILELKQEVRDNKCARDFNVKCGRIEFKNVTFSYDEIKVLKNISFTVPAGKVVALVGQSGSGKTSIMRLLLRFYDVIGGEILIDGENINKVTQKSLRRTVGIVSQDTVLFNETLKHNIKYSKLDAEDEEVIAAAKSACIHETILKFPEGYSTIVGERGLKLSGGEKQRVTIARTLLKNPRIVVLDEATSALDAHTEKEIQMSFQKLCKNRTSLIITHKLSTITHADEILVLSNGVIVERGKHEDLITKNGEYASMWQIQGKGE